MPLLIDGLCFLFLYDYSSEVVEMLLQGGS